MQLFDNLKALRVQHKWSQEELAERLAISRQAIAKWESGSALPELDKLVALAALYQITLDDLVQGKRACAHREPANPAMDHATLLAFLLRAAANTYAGMGKESDRPCRPGSHDLHYSEGNCHYMDTYLGGTRFVGEEALFVDGQGVWSMNYVGRTLGEGFSGDFLKTALLKRSAAFPFRGPLLYREGHLTYQNEVDGDFTWFSGQEAMYYDERKVYECRYHGGLVEA